MFGFGFGRFLSVQLIRYWVILEDFEMENEMAIAWDDRSRW